MDNSLVVGKGLCNSMKPCKEQYCRGRWNVWSINQDKLDTIKQHMTRMKNDILGISELKWMGMGEFNGHSDDHYIYYYGKEKKLSSPHSQPKSLKCSTWVQS